MSKRFHITIKDNQTGTVEVDVDTDCIIGATEALDPEGREGTMTLGYTDCNAVKLVATAVGATKLVKHIINGKGKEHLSMMFLAALAATSEVKIEEEEQKDGVDGKAKNGGVVLPFPTSRKDRQS